MILGAPGTPIAAYDQDSWVTSGHYEKRDARRSVELFRVVREANLALLKSLTPAPRTATLPSYIVKLRVNPIRP